MRTRLRQWALRVLARLGRPARQGVTLIELVAVAVILGVFALIVVPNVVSSFGLAKTATLQGTLGTLQDATSQFYATTDAYPTYSGSTVANQPVAGSSASEINTAAQDPSGTAFLPGYIRTAPTSTAANLGLNTTNGTTVYYGITASGITFATQAAPSSTDTWSCTTSPPTVYTQNNTAGVSLSTIC